jgi:hypothetical protein
VAEAYPADETRRPRRRGRRALVVLLILLLVVGGLLVVADRVAVGVAERAIADQVSQEVAKQQVQSAAPEVEVAGFPFLTQVVDGRYERISILLRDVQGSVQGNAVSLPELDVDARNVTASIDTIRSGQGDVVAETVAGTGTITYESLAKLIDRPGVVLGERNGKLAITAPLEILGQKLTVNGIAELTVDDQGKVGLRFDDLTADGLPNVPIARTLLSNYARSISIDVPLPELPFQLTVREVRPLPGGLAVTADARNVPINSAG